jgi:hypothetical protein
MAEAQTEASAEPKIIHVPITKGKTTLAIDTNTIPDDVFAEVVLQGLKVLLNRGMSKVTKEAYPNAEEMKSKAVEVAQAQVELVMTSKIKFTGGKKKSGATGAVMTEARRLAKALVKDELKRAGIKISHVEASEITKYANDYLETEAGHKLVEQAKANLADREKVSIGDVINVKSIAISEKRVQAAEAKKANKGTLSAKQAGKVATRKKGGGEAHATQH